MDPATHPRATAQAARLRAASAAGPNFAGHLAVALWECGRGCLSFLILDVRTGRVHDGLYGVPPVHFRSDSRLLVVEPPLGRPGEPRCASCTTTYYLWDRNGLRLIWPTGDAAGSEPPPARSRALLQQRATREAPLLRRHTAVTRPTWNRLVIGTRGGRRRVFDDDVVAGELMRLHALRGWVPRLDAWVVERTMFPEGRQLFLVPRDGGAVLEIDELPVVSPDGLRFVTASLDLVAGHRPNRVRIYRTDGGIRLEGEIAPRGWGARDPVWDGAGRIRVSRVDIDPRLHPGGERSSTAWLVLGRAGWEVAPPPAR